MTTKHELQHILVTGAAGFIGSFLCETLIANGYDVIGIDNFFRGKRENLKALIDNPHFQLEELDLSDAQIIHKLHDIITKNHIQCIFHLAAINGTQYFYDRPLFVLDQNITITQNVLSAVQNTSVQYLIYTSSSEVYGDATHIPTNEQNLIHLNMMADRDSYAASKALDEFYVRLFAKQHNIQALVFRVFNLYGTRMVGTRYGQVIPEFIQRILHEKTFTIIGDGSHTRSFCYIQDAINLMMALMEKRTVGLINMGHDDEITILQLAKILHTLKNRPFNPVFLPERPNDHKRRCPDIQLLKSLVPNYRFTSLITGLEKVIQQ